MAKNIVICSDGTGNTAIKDRGTNVFKIFESVDLNGHRFDPKLDPQIAIYDDGVGTERFKPLKVFAGATGWGLGRNVRQLYKELCRVYDPGDRIYLFGFSRGAFTVRTLAGLIARCGIIEAKKQPTAAKFETTVRLAYKTYRKMYRTVLMELFAGKPAMDASRAFQEKYCHRQAPEVHFIGVWDTVDAVGLPFHIGDLINSMIYRFKFPDQQLCPQIKHAYHALSLDDERDAFHPLLWEMHPKATDQEVEQIWFAGAHSNVGGGYPKQGMSLVALDWLMQKAREAKPAGGEGLRFVEADRAYVHSHANVDDKLYDPRAGLGMFYRWKLRDVDAICRQNGVHPLVHLSVFERIAHGTEDYTPGNLPRNASVVFTKTGDPDKNASAATRAKAAEAVLRAAHGKESSLLTRVRGAMAVGLCSYYLYLLSCLAALFATGLSAAISIINPILLLPLARISRRLFAGNVRRPAHKQRVLAILVQAAAAFARSAQTGAPDSSGRTTTEPFAKRSRGPLRRVSGPAAICFRWLGEHPHEREASSTPH